MANLETIDVQEFYEQYVPQQFVAKETVDGGYTVQHQINDTVYSLRVNSDGKLEVLPGSADDPLMMVYMRESDWRDAITGRVDVQTVLAEPGKISSSRLQKVRELCGKLDLELSREDLDPWCATIIFNGGDSPAVVLKVSAENYAAIQRGDLNSQLAFVTGKLKFEGDLGLLMKLGALFG